MEKIKVGILGATGAVGQRFIQLLENHPWFEVVFLVASQKSAGKLYKDAVKWKLETPIPKKVKDLFIFDISNLNTNGAKILFSGLDSSVAGEVEEFYAKNGYIIISNSKNHRMVENVPLLIPEINYEHINLINHQSYKGAIITNPNCSATFFTLVCGILNKKWPIEMINVVTMQAISGAGYPGIASYDILGNVVPFISGEEDKMESEPQKIMGTIDDCKIIHEDIIISASANRVAVIDGHTESISVSFKGDVPSIEELKNELKNYESPIYKMNLPTAVKFPVRVMEEDDRPQPRLDIGYENGMAVSVGRIRKDNIFDYKMTILGHNTIKGAAGAAILNAELFVYLFSEKLK